MSHQWHIAIGIAGIVAKTTHGSCNCFKAMLSYIIRQLVYSILIVFGVVTVTFVLIRVLPAGDPARLVAGQRTDLQTLESIRRAWKLDRPIYEQYLDYLGKVAQGDLG